MRLDSRTKGNLKTCIVLFFAAVLMCGFYLQRGVRAAAAPEKKDKAATIERGRAVYVQNCARCHGSDGRAQTDTGQLYGATDLADGKWWREERISDRRLIASITNGKKGGMPAYGKKLAKTDIAAVVAFVRTLKQ
jgi:cbb3-type cytochrome c oxidase subunit III